MTFPNTPLYLQESTYWSNRQAELQPSCFVTPRTAQDVSKAVKIITSRNTPFTVKGGGHTGYTGGSNIQDGVTIDLLYMKEVKVSKDRKTVTVGPGNRWVDIYEQLDPLGLSVVGGRADTVGVSGLTLGGGISYFSGSYGWACDNVKLYEVVTASGDILTATPTTNKDLYWALRGGGGSNFGIVTRFDIRSFDQGELWASSLILPGAFNTSFIPLIQDFAVNGVKRDPLAHQYFVMAYSADFGGYLILSDQFHPSAKTIPEPFKPLHQFAPVFSNNTRLANVTQLSRDIHVPGGHRQNFAVTSVAATSAQLFIDYTQMWKELVDRMLVKAAGSHLLPLLVIQPIPTHIIELMQVNGGNALGLKPSDGPLMLVQLSFEWSDPALDATLETEANNMINKFNQVAKQRGLYKGFIYMNYASRLQDVYASYGLPNALKLKLIALKYDPFGRFKSLWRGYFKL